MTMRPRSFLVIALLALMGASQSKGQTYWYTSSGVWSNPADWYLSLPANDGSANLVFNYSGTVTSTVDTSYSIYSLALSGATGSLTIGSSGGSTLTIASGGSISYGDTQTVALDVPILGAGSLLLNGGTGTVTLNPGTGSNTYSGSTMVYAGGTLQDGEVDSFSPNSVLYVGGSPHGAVNVLYNEAIAGLADVAGGAGYVNLNPGSSLFITGTYSTTFSGIIQGSGNLEKDNIGTLTLENNDTYTGTTTIAAGAGIDIGGGGSTGSIASNSISGTGSIAFDLTSNYTYAGVISGGINVVKDASGTTTLIGSNTYTGPTTINGGTLQAGSASAFGNSTQSLAINNSGTLDLNGFNITLASVQSSTTTGGIALNGAATLTLSDTSASKTIAGAITGTGSLNTSNYQLNVTGNANTYSGGTTITSGTLIANNSNGSDSATGTGPITIQAAGALLLGQANTNGYIYSGSAITDNGALQFFRTDVTANVISNSISGTGTVAQNGSGITELSGTNTYSGVTTVFNGTLEAGSLSAFGGPTGKSQVSFTYQGTLALNGFNNTVGSITGPAISGGVSLGANTLTINDSTSNTNFAAVISGSGGSLVFGGQSMILTGSNTYTGSTTINNGLILLANASGYGTGTGPITIAAPGTLQIGANYTTGAVDPTSTITDNGILAFSRTDSISFPNAVSGTGGVNLLASGQIDLTHANTYSGSTQVEAGTLLADNPSGSATGTGNISISSGATVEVGNADTNGAVAAASILDNGSLEFARTDNITVGSDVSGTGSVFVQELGGTVTLTGPNTYSGPTQINGSILADGATDAFSPNSSVQFGSGSMLAVGHNETVGDLENNGGTGAVTLAPGTVLTIGVGNAALAPFTGIISGAGGLAINTGSNSQGLGGASMYGGVTTMNSGEIFVSSSTVGAPGSITSGPIGTNTLVFAGNGEMSSIINPVTLANAISLGGYNLDNDDATTNLTLTGLITGAGGSITWCTNNNLALINSNTFTGGVDMREGTLLLGSDTAAGSGQITLDSGTIIDAFGSGNARSIPNPIYVSNTTTQIGMGNDNNLTFTGIISGSGTSVVTIDNGPSGSVALSGTNTISNTTFNVNNGGTVFASNNSAFGDSTNPVIIQSGSTLNVLGGVTISDPITVGAGANTFAGSGTITNNNAALPITNYVILSPSASPGGGPGNLTFSAPLIFVGGAIHFQLYDATGSPGTGWGEVSVTGSGDLDFTGATTNSITFNVVSVNSSGNSASTLNFNPATSYSWTFATAPAIVSFSAADFNIITTGFNNSTAGGGFSVSQVGNNLELNFTPVPEPSTWALMGAGTLALGFVALRRRGLAGA
jgi:fibronectin-binding autotransporter adhesin